MQHTACSDQVTSAATPAPHLTSTLPLHKHTPTHQPAPATHLVPQPAQLPRLPLLIQAGDVVIAAVYHSLLMRHPQGLAALRPVVSHLVPQGPVAVVQQAEAAPQLRVALLQLLVVPPQGGQALLAGLQGRRGGDAGMRSVLTCRAAC